MSSRLLLGRGTALLVLLASLTSLADDRSPPQSIFDGASLAGWTGDPTVWSVAHGVIRGSTLHREPLDQNTFLVWQGGKVADFRLSLEFRIQGGNSGIQYRSVWEDQGKWRVKGFQADIDAARQYTGILYEELGRGILTPRGSRVFIDERAQRSELAFADADELRSAIREGDWNRYVIEARGPVTRHWGNGILLSETEDHSSRRRRGLLALQVHSGPPMSVEFRNIRLRQYGADAPQAEAAPRTPRPAELATSPARMRAASGFRVELVYSVPLEDRGSWVSLAVDPQGRLIASDQSGYLYRVQPAPLGTDPRASFVERLRARIGMAQGMTFVGDRLFVVVNGAGLGGLESGLYCLTDEDRNDQFENVRLLRKLEGEGEHGPHAVVPAPDGQSLFVVCGNHTALTEIRSSRVPRIWAEDQLVPRLWDASGHAVGILAPGGWIARTDLDGRDWELFAIGFRNCYDIAFDEHGELFTYDSDMEWDLGAPWYRPTRICHVPSGAEFGWRSGSGKWPAYSPDSLPPTCELGPGSPTGIAFGRGTKFPEPYQRALFACDWSFGRMVAVHLKPTGATYEAEVEEFLSGSPLPLTDLTANPVDGAMYFLIGGRQTQSGLYRIVHDGGTDVASSATRSPPLSKSPPSTGADPTEFAKLRRGFERWHGKVAVESIGTMLRGLEHPDRYVRFAARTALEWQPRDSWETSALALANPTPAIAAVIALARCSTAADRPRTTRMLDTLMRLDWSKLETSQKLAWIRACELVLIRTESDKLPDIRSRVMEQLRPKYPDADPEVSERLVRLLAHLLDPSIAEAALEQMERGVTQEVQVAHAYDLREAVTAFRPEQQQRYFQWFLRTDEVRGGHSLRGFLDMIRKDAAERLTEAQRISLKPLLETPLVEPPTGPVTPSLPVIKRYTIQDVAELASDKATPRNFAQARATFAKALCFKCHRVGSEGGSTGPDLTTATRRFSPEYLATSLVEPNREISDRYRTSTFVLASGKVVTGRIANMNAETVMVVTDMFRPGTFETIDRGEIEEISDSPSSEMPEGLLEVLTESEVRELFAYLRTEGTPPSP